MQFRKIDASAGAQWLKEAWAVFKLQPFTFIMMHVFIIVVGLLPLLAPVLNVAASLIAPFLTIGFYQAVIKKQQRQDMQLADILAPLFNKGHRRAVLHLAMCQVIAALLISVIAQYLFADMIKVFVESDAAMDSAILLEQLVASFHFSHFVVFLFIMMLNYSAFAYSLPLVFFHKTPLFTAIKMSLQVFLANVGALSVFGAIVAFLMVISIPLQMLPLLIIMPVAYIGFFIGFQAIFKCDTVHSDPVEFSSVGDLGTKTKKTDKNYSDHGRFDA
ncbi:hypothetical protein PALB_6380 [Pseudoalteromonas luteoviolacea B = ATCC 29581]|nr:hypothetical protein PALB_6380 [Pseudoalteromonas luteoviolacea B = ATCC 29581]